MPASDSPLYLDPSRPIAERVQDLLGRLTLEEKISQMLHECPPIPRLGMAGYNYWSEGLHGVADNGRATVFPQAIGLAAAWEADLIYRVASAIGDEARAKHHAALRRNGSTALGQGLTFWSPNINIFRDPRWGRGQETYGEDPCLTGELGVAYVRGLQGDDQRYLKAAACAKHFAAHSGPEGIRAGFNARVSLRDLYDTYLPAFKRLVTEAKVEAVMGAYNAVNGEPCCASPTLLGKILRQAWQFSGHVVSDCWALTNLYTAHKVAADAVEAGAMALKNGCELSCGVTFDRLGEAIERGLVTEADIDRALAHTLGTRFKLGMFDPPAIVPYTSVPLSVVNCPEHQGLAHEAARKSMVLLKNRGNLLPLDESRLRRIFVTGPNATNTDILFGSYTGLSPTPTTLLGGILGRAPEGVRVTYNMGCTLDTAKRNPLDWATSAAGVSDVTVACMGLSPLLEGEEGASILSPNMGDRLNLGLPAPQIEYLKRLAATGGKIVLVLCGGGPVTLGEVEDLVDAIIFVWYPGQAGGLALADLLFGDAAPSGKLPVTFPKSVDQLPPFEDYAMTERTYRYSQAEPLYPFGFGLSYTRFAYQGLKLQAGQIAAGETLSFSVTLANAGAREAEEVAQVYLSDLEASVPVPQHKLVAFRRVSLKPGESQTLAFTLAAELMKLVDESGAQRLEPGQFRLTVGGCSPGARGAALGAPAPVSAVFTVR